MTLSEAVLRKKANNLEVKKSDSITLDPACLSALEKLFNDVLAILRPMPSDYKLRDDLVQIFNPLAQKIPGSDNGFPIVEAFGSFAMDMFTSKSDLDLSINFSNDEDALSRDKKILILRKFSKVLYVLQRQGHVRDVQPILRARVPILKVVDTGTGVECDISVENKDGIARSKILGIVSAIDERFRGLSLLMKAWAQAHDINSSKDRTLSSVSIISLVAFHLQTRDPPILPAFSSLFKDGIDIASLKNVLPDFLHFGRGNKESLAELFVSLLIKLSSVEALWSKGLCASPYEGSWILKTWNSKVGNISVEDFIDRSDNIARCVGKVEVEKIYKCIHRSLEQLSAFGMGKIQAPDLKILLFGSDATHTSGEQFTNAKISSKRSIPSNHSANQYPVKRIRYTGPVRRYNGMSGGDTTVWDHEAARVDQAISEASNNEVTWRTNATGVKRTYGEIRGNISPWDKGAARVDRAYSDIQRSVAALPTPMFPPPNARHLGHEFQHLRFPPHNSRHLGHGFEPLRFPPLNSRHLGHGFEHQAALPTATFLPLNSPHLGHGLGHPPNGFRGQHGPNPMFPISYNNPWGPGKM